MTGPVLRRSPYLSRLLHRQVGPDPRMGIAKHAGGVSQHTTIVVAGGIIHSSLVTYVLKAFFDEI